VPKPIGRTFTFDYANVMDPRVASPSRAMLEASSFFPWAGLFLSMPRFPIAAVLLLASLVPGAAALADQVASFDKSSVTIDTVAGPRHFAIELARTPQQQELGLMFRPSISPDAGMLFDFGETRPATFWMKNTLISLDMLFITSDGHVADIHEHAEPLSEDVIRSQVPVRAVLEVKGDTVEQLGIRVGDIVHHPIFHNIPGS
jgi:uncharacterized protein